MLPLLAQVSVSLQTQFNIIFIQPAARMLTYFNVLTIVKALV